MQKNNQKKKETLFNFVKKTFFPSKPTGALMIKRGASEQVLMVLGQAKGSKKPKEMLSCYLCGIKYHIAKNYCYNISE